jgi:hypothetical protein
MNRILLGAFCCALLAGCLSDRGPRPGQSAAPEYRTHSFGIYLTAGHVEPAAAATNLSALELVATPVISDADIVAVDLTNGVMKLTSKAFERLPASSVGGTFFVAVADGERLFVGAFCTTLSPSGPPANAMIGLDRVPGQDYLFLGWYDPRRERGGSGWWLGKEEAAGDLWSDLRVKKCLESLHKLGHVQRL